MVDRNVRDGNWVDQLVPDPANPPQLQVLTGYRGRSAQESQTRLYSDLELSSWVDVPNDAILFTREEPGEHGLPLTLIWTGLDAKIQTGPQAAQGAGAGAEWFQGQVAQDFGEAALPGSIPPRTPIFGCRTPLAGCPTPPRLCFPTPPRLCPSPILRCPPRTPWLGCPTPPVICPTPGAGCPTPPQFCPTVELRTTCCPTRQIGCPSLGIACTAVQCPTRNQPGCHTFGFVCTPQCLPIGQGFEGGWEGMQNWGGGFEAQVVGPTPPLQTPACPTPACRTNPLRCFNTANCPTTIWCTQLCPTGWPCAFPSLSCILNPDRRS